MRNGLKFGPKPLINAVHFGLFSGVLEGVVEKRSNRRSYHNKHADFTK
jgi:hypothetical protein